MARRPRRHRSWRQHPQGRLAAAAGRRGRPVPSPPSRLALRPTLIVRFARRAYPARPGRRAPRDGLPAKRIEPATASAHASVMIPADARTDDTRVDKTIERIARPVNQPAIGARAHVNDVRARGLAGLAHVTSLTVATGPRGRINPPVPPIEMPRDLAFCQSTCRDIDHDSVVRRDEPQLTRPSPVASSLAETRSRESEGFDTRASLSSGSRSR